MDSFHVGFGPDPASQKSSKIMENSHKKSTKITRISYIILRLRLFLTHINNWLKITIFF